MAFWSRAAHVAKTAPTSPRLITHLEDEAEAVNALSLIFTMDDVVDGMDTFFDDRNPDWQDT